MLALYSTAEWECWDDCRLKRALEKETDWIVKTKLKRLGRS